MAIFTSYLKLPEGISFKNKNYENSAVSKQRNEAFEEKNETALAASSLGGVKFPKPPRKGQLFPPQMPCAVCEIIRELVLVKWVWSIVGVQPVCWIFDHHPKILVGGASFFPTWKKTLRWTRCRQLDCVMGYLWVINHLPSEMHIQVMSASMQLTTHCRLVFYAHYSI